MIRLPHDVLEPYLSEYLLHGWQREAFSLDHVDVEPGRIAGYINVDRFHMPIDGAFHLSAQAALVWISQLGIIYGCWENQLPRKLGEVYLRDVSLRFNRPVRRTRQICFRGRFDSRKPRRMPDGTVYYKQAQIDVDDGAFAGFASFIVPIAAPLSRIDRGDQTFSPMDETIS